MMNRPGMVVGQFGTGRFGTKIIKTDNFAQTIWHQDNLAPWKPTSNHESQSWTMKNLENQPEIMGNQPGTMKNREHG